MIKNPSLYQDESAFVQRMLNSMFGPLAREAEERFPDLPLKDQIAVLNTLVQPLKMLAYAGISVSQRSKKAKGWTPPYYPRRPSYPGGWSPPQRSE